MAFNDPGARRGLFLEVQIGKRVHEPLRELILIEDDSGSRVAVVDWPIPRRVQQSVAKRPSESPRLVLGRLFSRCIRLSASRTASLPAVLAQPAVQ